MCVLFSWRWGWEKGRTKGKQEKNLKKEHKKQNPEIHLLPPWWWLFKQTGWKQVFLLIQKHQESKISDWMKWLRTKLRKRGLFFRGLISEDLHRLLKFFQQLQSDGLVCQLLRTCYSAHATSHTLLCTHYSRTRYSRYFRTRYSRYSAHATPPAHATSHTHIDFFTNIYCCQSLLTLFLVRSFWVAKN